MSPAAAGWIILGIFCVASLTLMLVGAVHVALANRELKAKLARLQETQLRAFDPRRLNTLAERLSDDVTLAQELLERARRAIATLGVAVRYVTVAVRIVKLLS